MNPTKTEQLLDRVALRRRAASIGRRFYLFTLLVGGAYGALLLVSRLTALLPDAFEPITLAAPVLLAFGLAVLLHERTGRTEAARLVDRAARTSDLFLTATRLEGAPGAYHPLVAAQAEQQAESVQPALVLPFDWTARAGRAAVLMGLLAAGVVWLPQLDPFGQHKARLEVALRKKRLDDGRKETKKRLALLKKTDAAANTSAEVKKAVDELKKTFGAMKPGKQQKKPNRVRLSAEQIKLAKLWRNASAKSLKSSLENASTSQRFGLRQAAKAAQMRQALKKGNTEPFKKEVSALQKLAKQLAKAKDPEEKAKLRKQLKKKLKALQAAMPGEDTSGMKRALSRAMDQLMMSEDGKLAQDAMKGLEETLKLSKDELEQLGQMMRDKKKLEDALKTLQMAKALNNAMEGLDGEKAKGDKSLEEYEKLYKQMLAELGEGEGEGGEGGGGDGRGTRHKGGAVTENDKTKTKFKTEKAKSALTAGKILMKWRTDKKQVSKAGEAREDYRRNVEKVKQGVSEAILAEQVPPGYHESIKKYFDRIDKDALPKK